MKAEDNSFDGWHRYAKRIEVSWLIVWAIRAESVHRSRRCKSTHGTGRLSLASQREGSYICSSTTNRVNQQQLYGYSTSPSKTLLPTLRLPFHLRARISPRRRVSPPLLDSRFSNVDCLLNEWMGEIHVKSCVAATLVCGVTNNDTNEMRQKKSKQ